MTTKPHAHLRTRILIWSFVPTAIILSAVAITIYQAYQNVTEDLVLGRNQQLTRLSAGKLGADLSGYVNRLSLLARSPDIYAGGAGQQTYALVRAETDLLVFDGGTIILDPFGKVVATQPQHRELLGQDWSDRGFFRQVLRSGAPAFSDVMAGDEPGSNAIAVGVPIMSDNGEFQGVLAGVFRLGAGTSSAFYGEIVRLRLGESGSTFLVDSTGRIIYAPDESQVGVDLHAQPDVQQVLSGQSGYLRTRDLKGVDILATFAPVAGTSWGLVTEESWSSLLASSRGYGQFLLLLLVLGILMPTLVVMFGVKRITDPLAKLMAASKEIAGGKYGQQIDVQTGDELEALADQFNQMSSQLQESYSLLEQRVQARTQELQTLNTMAAVASSSLNREEILQSALEKTIEVMGMDIGAAYCLEDGKLQQEARHNLSEAFVRQASGRALRDSVVEPAARTGHPMVWSTEEFPEPLLKPLLEEQGITQSICVPLMSKGRLVGALNMGSTRSQAVAPEAISLLEAIGQQIGVAVHNAQMFQQAEETAAIAERTRLARDLHDAVTQTLFSASLIAEVLPDLWELNQSEARRRLEELRMLTRGALAEMRTLLVELRPNALVEIPLPDLLRQLSDSFIGRARLPIRVEVQGVGKLPAEVQVSLYRIAQEALNNVAKHSKATQAWVSLCLDEIVQLEIADDGSGFDPAGVPADHLGLKIMRERAESIGASLRVESERGKGTHIIAHWKNVTRQGDET